MAALFSKRLADQSPYAIKCLKRRPGLALFCSMKTPPSLALFCLAAIIGLDLPALPAQAAIININSAHGMAYGNSSDGGVTNDLPPNDNQLNINPGADVLSAYGAYSGTAATANNTVNLRGGMVRGAINGGYSGNGNATGNSVTISGGTRTGPPAAGGIIGGESSSGNATGNSVTISGGTQEVSILGGYSSGSSGNATGNSVTISGGTMNGSYIFGGFSYSGNATGNSVTISGGTINGNVFGSQVGSGSGDAINNTVTISGNPILGASTSFYGGNCNSGGGDQVSGNILNKNSAVNIYSAENFEYVNFGYSGNANIGSLATTGSMVKLDTQGHNISFGGVIINAGSIEKRGSGTLTLSGANTYTGNTTVSAGTLQVTGSLGGGTYAGAIANNGALEFNQAGAQTLSGIVSGSGALTKSGAGTLTLSNNNTYTGLSEVREGTLALTGTGRLGNNGSGGLSLFGGTTFNFSGLSAASLSLPRLTVNGQGAAINATGKTADFTNGSLFFNIPNTTAADSVLLTVTGNAKMDGSTAVGLDTPSGRPNLSPGEKVILLEATSLDATGFTELTVQTKSGDTYFITGERGSAPGGS
jgi:autotransporter-associated beta strand protein